jgi:hypothetical protein
MRTEFMERRGKIEELDRSFDVAFWQSQTAQERFDATWELIVHAWVCPVDGEASFLPDTVDGGK